jgi:hypothetical protein
LVEKEDTGGAEKGFACAPEPPVTPGKLNVELRPLLPPPNGDNTFAEGANEDADREPGGWKEGADDMPGMDEGRAAGCELN